MNDKLSMEQLGRKSAEEVQGGAKIPVVIILENIRSGLNVGSIFRSADAFMIEKIYCCGYTCSPPHREVLKSALGATETVLWEYRENTIELIHELKSGSTKCFAIEQTSNSIDLNLYTPSKGQKTALILGNEVSGVSQSVVDACTGSIEITQYGSKHSLNVAVCAGIIMYHFCNAELAK